MTWWCYAGLGLHSRRLAHLREVVKRYDKHGSETHSMELTAQLVLLCSAISLTIPVYAQSFRTTLFGQTLFEFCVGMYWRVKMHSIFLK